MTDFTRTRSMFRLPEGVVYLDGNSLGPLPVAAAARVMDTVVDEWGGQLIGGWNGAGWMAQPRRLGDRIGRLIGAPTGTVVVGDTLSIKVYQALGSALELNPDRRVILSDSGNFPTDLYMASGLIRSLGRGYELRVVAPEAVAAAIDDSVAVLMLTEVDYRTGRLHHMAALTRAAHAAGAVASDFLHLDLRGADDPEGADHAETRRRDHDRAEPLRATAACPMFRWGARAAIPVITNPISKWTQVGASGTRVPA